MLQPSTLCHRALLAWVNRIGTEGKKEISPLYQPIREDSNTGNTVTHFSHHYGDWYAPTWLTSWSSGESDSNTKRRGQGYDGDITCCCAHLDGCEGDQTWCSIGHLVIIVTVQPRLRQGSCLLPPSCASHDFLHTPALSSIEAGFRVSVLFPIVSGSHGSLYDSEVEVVADVWGEQWHCGSR